MLNDDERKQKKESLVEKSFELFVKQGLENTSINDLSKHCGTYKSAFYNYFKSKDEIVIECAKSYMQSLDTKIKVLFHSPSNNIVDALKQGIKLIVEERNKLRYIYQVISSPKYGTESRDELSKIYIVYFDYSKKLSDIYNVEHDTFRPYFLLYMATVHDFCLWENEALVNEKLEFIYSSLEKLFKK